MISLNKLERYELKKYLTKLKIYIKMEKIIIKFGDIEIEKQNFDQYKRPISIKIYILIK